MSEIREIREKTGMSRAEFSRAYGIPVRTLEDWEAEKRKCPDYVTKLLRRVVSEDSENAIEFKLYANNELMKELGACYKELLKIMNRNEFNGREPHNPYPNADIFPTKYFTMILPQAMRIGIPDQLNDRIGVLMNFVDPEDWAKSMNLPCPAESRMFFNMGMMM